MVPPVYREEDALAQNPGVLFALVKILAGQAVVLRRSNDQLWDDQFIDLCSSWAISYIADLVGTRLVSSLNARARRVDVAKTIYYRRRNRDQTFDWEQWRSAREWELPAPIRCRVLRDAEHLVTEATIAALANALSAAAIADLRKLRERPFPAESRFPRRSTRCCHRRSCWESFIRRWSACR